MQIFKSNILFLFFLTWMICVSFASTSFGQYDWTGSYVYTEKENTSSGVLSVHHRIRIYQQDGKLRAHFFSFGFGTQRDLHADVKTKGNLATFEFSKYGFDHEIRRFQKGENILALRKEKEALITEWKTYGAAFKKNDQPEAVAFLKTKPSPQGETPNAWVGIDFANSDLRFSVPSNFLVSKEKTFNSFAMIHANSGDTQFDLSIQKSRVNVKSLKAGSRKKQSSSRNGNRALLTLGKYLVLRQQTQFDGRQFFRQFKVTSSKRIFHFTISGPIEKAYLGNYFLRSISSSGDFLDEGSVEVLPQSRIEQFRSLDTSEVVMSFLKLKRKKVERKITYSLESGKARDNDVRTAFVFRPPEVGLLFSRNVTAWYELRANGHIGDIHFESNLTESELKRFLQAILKMRFVPKRQNGRYVSSWRRTIFSRPTIRIR